jgi:DNA-binding MurR/RpiR family transcriptional regulator
MLDIRQLEAKVEETYPRLGPQLKRAARFVLAAPSDVALYPLRQVAERAAVAPTTFVRLAEQLGFSSYKTLRDCVRETLRSGSERYAAHVQELLSHRAEGFERLYRETANTLSGNIREAFATIPSDRIEAAGRLLGRARRIYILGLRANYSAAFYFDYVLRTFTSNTVLLEDRLGMMIDELGRIGSRDVLLAISYEPYAIEAVKAVEYSVAAGARVIAFTDNAVSPITPGAEHVFVVPTGSTSFYNSLIPTIAILEALICYLAARGGSKTVDRVKEEFARRDRFGVYWHDGGRRRSQPARPRQTRAADKDTRKG